MMTFKMPEPSNPSDPSGQAQDVWWPRPFQLELLPTDRRDAVQAVLYRVGDPLHLMDPEVALTAALREARTERTLPLQKTRRRRWVAAAPVEEPADVAREPHERPALVAVAGLSRLLPGGLLLESLSDLGADPVERAVVLGWLADHAGVPSQLPDGELTPEVAAARVATFTVGDLGGGRDRRDGELARSDRAVHHQVRQLVSSALLAVRSREAAARYAALREAFDAAAREAWDLPTSPGGRQVEALLLEHASSSELFADLSYDAACGWARQLRAVEAAPEEVARRLQLGGFVNAAGHKLWAREQALVAGGWRS